MNRQEANKQILDMYNDSTYQELKAYYEKTTIFYVLGVERSETRHSAFLCWLLNANASHGLGEEPMKKLLRLYATKMDDDSSFRIMLMTGDYELEMNDIVTEKSTSDEQGSKGGKSKKKDRMDVWATMTLKDMAGNEQSLALVIENKIYCGEGAEQTERYHQYVISNVLGKDTKPVEIFLTPAGDCGKLEGQRGTGDFYTNEKDLLVVQGERIMCVKWWKKTDGSFQQLIEHVRQNFPYIQIEEY